MNEVRPLEEVKAGLEHCCTQDVCDRCPYVNIESSYCQSLLMRDANEHLKQLEDENAKLKAELEELRPLATEPIPEDAFPSDEELRGEMFYADQIDEGDP